MSDPALVEYYAQRACEYERIYQKPERQAELAEISRLLAITFANRRVIEIACGTGYWTGILALTARHVTAIDLNEPMLELARAKNLPASRVQFLRGDAFDPGAIPGEFDAGFAGFWWSHVPRQRLPEFVRGFHAKLQANSVVVLIDNQYVEGNSTPISRRDNIGNTFQQRRLEDGRAFEVLKNFPADEEIRHVLRDTAALSIQRLRHYWCAIYRKV